MKYKYKLLLGGIGDDAHSIGISLLALGFQEAGFHVKNLGIRNTIHEFFAHVKDYDIILISNKNGHSELYLENFPNLLATFQLSSDMPKLWYLGGSLSVNEPDFSIKKKYLCMGFTNVYPKPVPFSQVLININQDIHRFQIPKRQITAKDLQQPSMLSSNLEDIIDRKWTEQELEEYRKIVINEFPEEAKTLQNSDRSFYQSLDDALWKSKHWSRIPLFQPRTGVANLDEQIDLLKYLENEGSDISSIQLDAASRSKMFDKAQQGRRLSEQKKASVLNGFPMPVYSSGEIRRLISSLKTPFQVRGGGPDHRFIYELALASGVSAVEGGFLCYLLPYDKLTSPTDSLKNWQFVDRLCASYWERQHYSINREYFGVLTATLLEPSIVIVVNIIQSLASAQQGINSIAIGYAEQGNRSQDIAALQVMEEMVHHYLARYQYKCRVTTVFHQYMAAFPTEYAKAEDLIFNSSITATLAGATKVMVKTAVEAIEIPNRFENGKAVRKCKAAAKIAADIPVDFGQIAIEKRIIKKTVNAIMEAIIELGNNSVLIGAIKAIEAGIIDIPWSPNIYNRNKVKGIRDISGAVRFIDFGNLPLDTEVKDFHLEKVGLRKMMERDSNLFSLLEKDLSRISMGDYEGWPLDRNYVN